MEGGEERKGVCFSFRSGAESDETDRGRAHVALVVDVHDEGPHGDGVAMLPQGVLPPFGTDEGLVIDHDPAVTMRLGDFFAVIPKIPQQVIVYIIRERNQKKKRGT
jgi:hypothetical protein